MLTGGEAARRTGLDAVAIKPTECDLEAVRDLPFDTVMVDFEGSSHVPDSRTLRRLARTASVRLTAAVRADGFDPLGDDRLYDRLPDGAGLVLVAGHHSYFGPEERRRPIAPRLEAALDRYPDAWVGTEGIKKLALSTGAPQFALLSPTVVADIERVRAGGFDGEVAVYAPTALEDDEDGVLDAMGSYAARREPVRQHLSEGAPVDSTATGRSRKVLLEACRGYALVGDADRVRERVEALREAGADRVVGYPARGLDEFR